MKLKKILNTWKINWYNQEHNFSNLHLRNKIFTPKNLHLRIKETVYIYIYIYIYIYTVSLIVAKLLKIQILTPKSVHEYFRIETKVIHLEKRSEHQILFTDEMFQQLLWQ